MPFYEYQCNNCGHALEAMQKVSDPPLKKCPHCGKPQLQKLMSAPVFRLKGGGWYETDFKSDQDNKRNLADRPEDSPKEEKKEGAAAESKEAPRCRRQKERKARREAGGESRVRRFGQEDRGARFAGPPRCAQDQPAQGRQAALATGDQARPRETSARPVARPPRNACRGMARLLIAGCRAGLADAGAKP